MVGRGFVGREAIVGNGSRCLGMGRLCLLLLSSGWPVPRLYLSKHSGTSFWSSVEAVDLD